MKCSTGFHVIFLSLLACFTACSNSNNENRDKDNNVKNNSDNAIKFAEQTIELMRFEMPEGGGAFLIGKYEVTNDQYAAFLKASGYDGSDFPSSKKQEPFFYNWRKDPEFIDHMNGVPAGEVNYPACYLNWHHADAFCKWLSKETGKTVRLPSEKEWQFVAAGKEKRMYPWGNEWDPKKCNWGGDCDGFAKSSPVGSFPGGATPEGVYDMAGNIWEWSSDKTLMGGPWCLQPERLKTNIAANEDPMQTNDKFGFRILVEDD